MLLLLIFKYLFIVSMFVLSSCSSSEHHAAVEDILHGTISYPFPETAELGRTRGKDPFIIRSSVGATEYVVEIPDGAEDFDVVVPLANLSSAAQGGVDRPMGVSNPAVTDRELVKALPKAQNVDPTNTSFVDRAFGVTTGKGPKQSPSYVLGLAKTRKMFQKGLYENALVELDKLLAFYPTSSQLHKRKGTVLLKLGHLLLAEKSWIHAFELDPKDNALKTAIDRLKSRIRISRARAPHNIPDPTQSNRLKPIR
ncbi:MAG: tetratricopeptide repeat protein [Oligoflexales bacterium]